MFHTSKLLSHLIGVTTAKTHIGSAEKENMGGNDAVMMDAEGNELNEFGFPYQNGERSPYFEFVKGIPLLLCSHYLFVSLESILSLFYLFSFLFLRAYFLLLLSHLSSLDFDL